MKKWILSALFSLGALLSMAQINATISEQVRPMSQGSFNALVVTLPGVSSKVVRDEWSSFVKSYKGKTAYNKKTEEVFSDNATIKDMSENTVDIFAKVVQKNEKETELVVWYNLGVSYLSSGTYAQGMPAADAMLRKFIAVVSASLLKAQLKEKEQAIKDMEKDLKKLEKEKAKFEKTVKSYEEDIKKIEDKVAVEKGKIGKNVETQGQHKAKIDSHQKDIQLIKKQISEAKRR